MRTEIKSPSGKGAKKIGADGCSKYTNFPCQSQENTVSTFQGINKRPVGTITWKEPLAPISWLIRRYLIKALVLQRYTRENSLRVDGLFVCAEFFEEADHVYWN